MSYYALTTGVNAPTWRLQGDSNLDGTGDVNAILGPANGSWTGSANYLDPPTGKGFGKAFSCASGHVVLAAADSLRPQNADWSCSFWFKLTSTAGPTVLVANGGSAANRPNFQLTYNPSTDRVDCYVTNGTSNVTGTRVTLNTTPAFTDTNWHFLSLVFDRTSNVLVARLDGVLATVVIGTPSGDGVSISSIVPDFATPTRLGGNFAGTSQTSAQIYDYRVYDEYALSGADDSEIYAGPEPTNTVAPAASYAGGVLSSTTGMWDSYSNGDLAYAYQWQSFGGSWSNISGATSSTYVPPSDGLYRCNVTASNNGGAGSPASTDSVLVSLGSNIVYPPPVNSFRSITRSLHRVLTEAANHTRRRN